MLQRAECGGDPLPPSLTETGLHLAVGGPSTRLKTGQPWEAGRIRLAERVISPGAVPPAAARSRCWSPNSVPPCGQARLRLTDTSAFRRSLSGGPWQMTIACRARHAFNRWKLLWAEWQLRRPRRSTQTKNEPPHHILPITSV